MGRVLRLRNVALVLLLAVAALLLLMSSSGDRAEATGAFTPSYAGSVSPAGPGIPGDLTTVNTIAAPDYNFETLSVGFIDKAWTVLPLSAPPNAAALGGVGGDLSAVSTLGILNGPCTTTTPVAFPLLFASVPASGGDGSPRGPADTTWTGFNDGLVNGGSEATPDGLADGITDYPSFLDTNVSIRPFTRLFGSTVVAGQPIAVNIITYLNGGLAAEFSVIPELGATFDNPNTPAVESGLGFASVVLLQNPAAADTPSNITDFCAPLVTTITTNGQILNNPATDPFSSTEGGIGLVNPTTGPYTMALFQVSDRDGVVPPTPGAPPFDGESGTGDGVEGDLDTCPYTDNVEDPRVPAPAGDPDGDAIDTGCDFLPLFTTDLILDSILGVPLSTSAPWSQFSPCRAGSGDDFLGVDCDADGFFNRQDACPQQNNFNVGGGNPDSTEITNNIGGSSVLGLIAPDGGPSDDGIGDGCDLEPFVSNGHFHEVLTEFTVDVLGVDSDLDGCLDFAEVLLGSDPGDITSTPENIVSIASGCPFLPAPCPGVAFGDTVPCDAGGVITCVDTVDNDGDGGIDFLGDTACGTLHDIEITSVSGNTKTRESQSKGYSVKTLNNGPAGEVAPVAVAVLSLTGCGPPATTPAGIDVNFDGVITAADGNIITDVNGDTLLDTLAFVATGVMLPGGVGNANFDVLYPDCPGIPPQGGPGGGVVDTTIADFVILADACHLGDTGVLAPLFGGAPCGGVGAPQDGGIDLLFGNDGPVTRIVNVSNYLLVDVSP